MKKLLVVGHSMADPMFFNTRVLQKENELDNYHFAEVLGKAAGIEDIEVCAVAGAGNEWISSALITKLPYIDKDTLVVVIWGFTDRVDMLITPDHKDIQNEINTCIDEQYDYLKFNRTFDFHGNQTEKGMRYWMTAHYLFGPKIKMKPLLTQGTRLKDFFETVSLSQRLLEETGAKQVHFLPLDAEHFTFKGLVQEITEMYMTGDKVPLYKVVNFTKAYQNFYEEHPEMLAWKKLVKWDLFSENLFDFCQRHQLPYICIDKFNNFHQPPINNYIYIKKAILEKLGLPCADILDEIKAATEAHCKKYNSIYTWNEEKIYNLIHSA